jgi:hypothetical protein
MSRPDLVRLAINTRKLREAGVADAPSYFIATSLRPRELTYCNCVNFGPNDGLDVRALSAAETDLRERMFGIGEMFHRHVAGCAECYVAGAAYSAGQRRARAIRCRYELTGADCTEGRRFDDEIALFSFIDRHKTWVRDAGAYGIPYRALVPQGLDNALIAGRMMSVEIIAHNSTRNTVCCLACGQAAGTAAAIAAIGGKSPAEVNVEELRAKLLAAGAILQPQPDPLDERP